MNTLRTAGLALTLGLNGVACDLADLDQANTHAEQKSDEELIEKYKANQEKREKEEEDKRLDDCLRNLSTALKLVASCHRIADDAHDLAYRPHMEGENRNTSITQDIDPSEIRHLSSCQINTRIALNDLDLCLIGTEGKLHFALEQ